MTGEENIDRLRKTIERLSEIVERLSKRVEKLEGTNEMLHIGNTKMFSQLENTVLDQNISRIEQKFSNKSSYLLNQVKKYF